MEFTNEVRGVQKEQNVNTNVQNTLIQNLSDIQNSPVQDGKTMDDLQYMANEIAQEESEELLFEETTEDDIMTEENLEQIVEKPQSNNIILLGLGVLLVAFFFRKELKDVFDNLFNKPKSLNKFE